MSRGPLSTFESGGLGFGMDHGYVRGGVRGLEENNTVGKKWGRGELSAPASPPPAAPASLSF